MNDLETAISHGALFFCRTFGFFVIFPSIRNHLGMSGLVTLACTLAVLAGSSEIGAPRGNAQPFLLQMGCEFLLGVGTGLPLVFALEVLPMSGRLADLARGAQFGEQINPALGVRTSGLEELGYLLIPVVIFSTGGAERFLELLFSSNRPPVGLEDLVAVAATSLTRASVVAAPIVVWNLFIDLASGAVARCCGRMQLQSEVAPLKLVSSLLLFGWGAEERLSVQSLLLGGM